MAKKHRNRERKYRRLGGSGELPESAVQKAVEAWLTMYGWRWTANRDSRRTVGHRGFPDITAVKDKRLLFIECKARYGKFGKGQEDWLVSLRDAGAVCFVARPDNLNSLLRFLKE